MKDVVEEKEQQAAVQNAPRKRGRPRKVVAVEKIQVQVEKEEVVEPIEPPQETVEGPVEEVSEEVSSDENNSDDSNAASGSNGINGPNGHGEFKLVSNAAVKRFISGSGFRISSEFYSAVGGAVEKMLLNACSRAESNKRKIIHPRDL